MNRYQLAKIVEWAGGLNSRKRLQKVAFLLQASGCPLDVDYTLHHYGPYSQEVARLSDEMVRLNLLEESCDRNQVGVQYSYRLPARVAEEITQLERTPKGRQLADPIAPFEECAKKLLRTDLWQLEMASTIVYFRKQGNDWATSIERTSKFKNVSPSALRTAEELARELVA